MIEPTDEMIEAYNEASWDNSQFSGLAAVLAIVERDYVVRPLRCPNLGTSFQCMRGAGHDGSHSGRLGEIEVSWS